MWQLLYQLHDRGAQCKKFGVITAVFFVTIHFFQIMARRKDTERAEQEKNYEDVGEKEKKVMSSRNDRGNCSE